MTTEDDERPRRVPWILPLSLLLCAVVPWLACPRLERWRGDREAREALGELESCLAGATSLRARVVAADLAGERRWPARCARPAAALEVALSMLQRQRAPCDGACCPDDVRCQELGALRGVLDRVRAAIHAAELDDALVQSLSSRARESGIEPVAHAGHAAPEPIVLPPPAEAIAGRYDAGAVEIGGDRITLMLHERGRSLVVCAVDAAEATASCRPVPAQVPIAGSVLLVDGSPWAPAHLLAGADGNWRVYRADGGVALRFDGEPLGAAVLRDGTVAVAAAGAAGTELWLGERGRASLELPDALGPPLLHGERVLWPIRDGDDTVLIAAELALPLAPREVARARGWRAGSVGLRPCRSAAGLHVLVTDDASAHAAVAFAGESGWTLAETEIGARGWGFTCAGDAAAVTFIEGGETAELVHVRDDPPPVHSRHTLGRIVCRIGSCRSESVPIDLDRHARGSRYLAGSLGEAATVLWRARLGEIRFRTATLGALATARDAVLFDDEDHGGLGWDSGGAELFAREGRALLLVQPAGGGTHAFVLGADGSARAVRPL
jgi:hypothetical protein